MNAINSFGGSQPVIAPARRRTARELLEGRVLTVMNWEAADMMAMQLDPQYEGLVITGSDRHKKARKLRKMYPDLVILAEGDSHALHESSEESPWYLPDDGQALLPAPDLNEVLAGQRSSGVSVTLLPAGYVAAGDTSTLRTVVESANEIVGDDLALPLYRGTGWLKPEHKEFLTAVIAMSTHPVLLAFGAASDPVDSDRKRGLYREIVAATRAFCWRTDLAGLWAFAHGGMGAAIGAAPSTRRFTPPGTAARSRRPGDQTPNVLIPGHMHWMKTGAMKSELYAGSAAPACPCVECDGRPIDRFTENQKAEAARHNHATVDAYVRTLISTPAAERPAVWHALAIDAVVSHEVTGASVGREWNAPEDVALWAAD